MTQTQNGLTIDYSYDALDQLLAVSSSTLTAEYTYTPNGTRSTLTTPAATVNYAYDALDRLLSVTAQPSMGTPTAHSFTYDADGRMVTSGTRQFLWDEASTYGDIVAEFDGGQLDASYVLGGSRLISQTTGTDSAYFLTDALGSTRALSDGAASLTETFTYDAYGGLYSADPFADFSTTTTPYLFTGHRYDSALGLYHARARVYDPAVGRFLSRDTWPVNYSNPIELNRYAYVAGNPVNATDPTGLVGNSQFLSGLISSTAGVLSALGLSNSLALLLTTAVVVTPFIVNLPYNGNGTLIGQPQQGELPRIGDIFEPSVSRLIRWLMTRQLVRAEDVVRVERQNDQDCNGLSPREAARRYAEISQNEYYLPINLVVSQTRITGDNMPVVFAITYIETNDGSCREIVSINTRLSDNSPERVNSWQVAFPIIFQQAMERNALFISYDLLGFNGHAEDNLIGWLYATTNISQVKAIGVSKEPCRHCSLALRLHGNIGLNYIAVDYYDFRSDSYHVFQ